MPCLRSNQKRATVKAQEKVETSSTKSTSAKVSAAERSSTRTRRGRKSPTHLSSFDEDDEDSSGSKAASSSPGKSPLPKERTWAKCGPNILISFSFFRLIEMETDFLFSLCLQSIKVLCVCSSLSSILTLKRKTYLSWQKPLLKITLVLQLNNVYWGLTGEHS